MRRATVNFWIDVVIGIAFLLSAFTGILFLLPASVRSVSATGSVAILGVSSVAWHTIHDWSGVVAAAGVILHFVLHWRWFTMMARRLSNEEGRAARRVATPPAARPARVPSVVTAEGHVEPVRAKAPSTAKPERGADDDRLSRRTFLVGLGAAAGATAFLGAAALLRADSGVGGGTALADSQSGAAGSAQSNGGAWQGGGKQDGNGWQNGGSTQGDGGSTTSQRVSVDAAACIGCGRCLGACPYGVFALSGGKAAVQDSDACRLCGHCVRVCPASAITLAA